MKYPKVDPLDLPQSPFQSMLDELHTTILRRVMEVRRTAAEQWGCSDVDVTLEPSLDGMAINIVARPPLDKRRI